MKNPKILVPVDFSETSLKGLDAARLFAELFDGLVGTLYVSESKNDASINEIISGFSQAGNQPAMERLQKHLKNVSIEHLGEYFSGNAMCKLGYPPTDIVKESKNYDMIIMTSHGRSGLSRLLLGSVAEKVTRESSIPVMIIKRDANALDLKKIMVTTDLSFSSTIAFPYAESIAKKALSDVDMVYAISYENFEWLSEIQTFIREQKENLEAYRDKYFGDIKNQVETKTLYSHRSVHGELIRQIEDQKYGLVIMSTLGKTGLDYLRLGSTAYSILRQTKAPLLLIPFRKV